jgi:hypothetical protein
MLSDPPPTAVPLAWVLGRRHVTSAISGPRTFEQYEQNMVGFELSEPPMLSGTGLPCLPRQSASRGASSSRSGLVSQLVGLQHADSRHWFYSVARREQDLAKERTSR